ncbi:NmrA family NAD(P)-binding protein [Siphonobacter aquaeclarae]|uniref:Uncharacterized conserved protein YbjT, contains NAD(P)-binding and DUF2867 domains n=1 Tax=Siphonobacter aquaeclarae TaxID=563176 RepID=A0A1G9R9E0_9BACT|nr:NAD(P)H-binding protein [Siphonobacter aquaeclarae]SDM19477.1 Uncharacterized conserved protein YbjT, contains NAD(P)-binding and DUF2867 domains [Siphonobacter aquaeclarae]
MKITLSGSLGNIGTHLVKSLVSAGHTVTVITSNPGRRAAIEALGATPAVGSVSDAAFLESAIRGADALFAMTPPNLGGADVLANTAAAGKAFADAIRATGITRVVMLSSVGADLPSGNGPIAGLYPIEKAYAELDGVAVTFLRAGYFYTNFYNDIPLIQGPGIMGGNFPASLPLALVHPADIAAAAAEELQHPGDGKHVRYIVSDVRTPQEIASAIGDAIGRPGLPWVEFSDEQSLRGMIQAGVPEEIAGLYTEMGVGFRSGRLLAHFEESGSPVDGTIRLETFAKEFSARF